MSQPEETGTPAPENATGAQGTDPNPAPNGDAGTQAAPAAEGGPKGWDAVSAWLSAQDISDDDLTAHLADVSEASLKDFEADPRTRVLLTAIDRRHKADRAAAEETAKKAAEERDAKLKAERDRLAQTERDLKARERAMLAAAAATKDPGDEPNVDPFTPEGAKALAKYNAERAHFEASKPLKERAAEEARVERWNAIVDAHPDLRKPDVLDAFNAFMEEKNKGVRAGAKPRLDTEQGAELFFNLRELDALRAERQKKQQADDVERAKAARNIGSSSGSAQPDYLGIYRQIRATRGEDAADEYLDNNPQAMAAWKRHFAPNHAH